MNPALLLALGLSATASEAEALERAGKLAMFEREVLETLSQKTAPEALGVVRASRAHVEQLTAAKAELASIKLEQAKAEATQLLDTAVEDGRLTPAARGAAEELHQKHGLDTLKAFVAALPQSAPSAPPAQPPVGGGPVSPLTLSADEKKLCALMGVDPEDFARWQSEETN